MPKSNKAAENRDQPLPFRPTPTAAEAQKRLVKLLKELGLPISASELLRQVTAPCLAPHLPYQLRPGFTTTYELVNARALSGLLGYRFFAGMLPLIERKEAVVSVEALAGGTWELLIWVSCECLFHIKVQKLEKAACEAEKSGKSETCGKATSIAYLTRRERRNLNRRAKKAALKRTRESGESRLVRLVASDVLPKFLQELEAQVAARPQPPQPTQEDTLKDPPNPS